MDSVIFKNTNDLNDIYYRYYRFLLENEIEDKESFKYIFEVLEYLDLSSKYLNTFRFNNSLEYFGLYIPKEKEIIFNLSKLKESFSLGYISRIKMILVYFNLLNHEITHAYQKYIKSNFDNDISTILNYSEDFKYLSNNDHNFYSLFPDEVHANLNSAVFVHHFASKYIENESKEELDKMLIYYLTNGLFRDNEVINSQLKYLYDKILNLEYEENFKNLSDIDSLYLGVTKSDDMMMKLVKSYETNEVHLDI